MSESGEDACVIFFIVFPQKQLEQLKRLTQLSEYFFGKMTSQLVELLVQLSPPALFCFVYFIFFNYFKRDSSQTVMFSCKM